MRRAVLLLAVTVVTLTQGVRGQVSPKPEPFNLAFTASVLAGMNVNDARAAMAVWAENIGRGIGLTLKSRADVFDDLEALGRAMDARQVHFVVLSTREYRKLGRPSFGTEMIGGRHGRVLEDYIIVAKRGRFSRLADLRGTSLATVDGISYDVSVAWLEGALADAGLGAPETFFSVVTKAQKPARGILPVFFGQQDACLISRYGFELMVELNPQIGRELAPVVTSPPLVHAVVSFDTRYAPAARPRLFETLLTLHTTPRGQQLLSVFGMERVYLVKPGDLSPTLDLLARYDRLRGATRRAIQ